MEINELSRMLKQNGIAGAGGAGFPSYGKLSRKIDTIILNCAECEPLLKLHRQLLELHSEEIIKAFHVIAETLCVKEAVIGIKKAYKEAVRSAAHCISRFSKMRVHELDDIYPMGDEVILIYETTGRIIRPGGLPAEEGIAVFNVETVYNIYRAVYEGIPVTDKFITIAGEVENPATIRVPIGVSLEEAVSLTGKITIDNPVYYSGGPMMGRIASKEEPVTKTTNGIIILPEDHPLVLRKQRKASIDLKRAASACCQCGTCTDLCPRHGLGHPIEPHRFMRSAAGRDFLNTHIFINTMFCSSCGLCEIFSCPQGLSPRTLINDFKNRLKAEGIKNLMDAAAAPIQESRVMTHNSRVMSHNGGVMTHNSRVMTLKFQESREYQKIPEERLKARLGILKYDKEAAIRVETAEAGRVVILMSQHIGIPAVPIVGRGDIVSKGQLIGEAADGLSLPVHASIDGIAADVFDGYIIIESIKNRKDRIK